MINLSVDIAGLKLKNPVLAASGTFAFGKEYSNFIDINELGGISVKGLTLKPRKGNKPPRICETPSGILNSVGLQNPGVKKFAEEIAPWLEKFDTAIIANIAGNTLEEYGQMAEILNDVDCVDALEINVSCPNVKEGCVAFGNTAKGVSDVTNIVRRNTRKPIIVKLTPNVTDITETARAAEASGADSVSLINTLLGMSIDIYTRKPILANNTGGLSGPCVKPIAVRMVSEVYRAVKIPIIGMGGISTWEDAVEFILAGASAVMVGTANFMNPNACIEVRDGIEEYMKEFNVKRVSDLVGKLELN